jgi:hypothetical protein
VQIEENQGRNSPRSSAATSAGASVAQAYSALFPTRLALARWMYGGDTPHVHSCTHHMARASWYDQAQQQFQAWIDAGGFHEPEPDHTDSAIRDASAGKLFSAEPDTGAASQNPAWYDITRCRLAQDNGCSE